MMHRIASTTLSEVTQATGKTTKGCVFFLHGSCDNGHGLKSWLRKILDQDFTFKTYRVLYPSAPKLPYHPHENKHESVWFNRLSFDHDAPEDLGSINKTANELSKLLIEENSKSGIPLSSMVIGGFSSGGSMALHLGYRFHPQLAGVFALSSYVPMNSIIFEHLEQNRIPEKPLLAEKQSKSDTATKGHVDTHGVFSEDVHKPSDDFMQPFIDKYLTKSKQDKPKTPQLPKLFMSQGFKDPLVKPTWAKGTFKKLRTCGVDGLFYSHPKQKHDICKNELNLLHIWIEDLLTKDNPSTSGDRSSKNEISQRVR